MADNKILSAQQIASINKMVNSAFIDEGEDILKIDIASFKKQIDYILRFYTFDENGKNKVSKEKLTSLKSLSQKHFYLQKQNVLQGRLAARGYELIMSFRHFLLEEDIDYRYYFTDSTGQSRVKNVKGKDILKYIRLGSSGLEIRKLTKDFDKADDNIYAKYATQHFDQLMRGISNAGTYNNFFRAVSGANGTYYVVRSNIMNNYNPPNTGLKNQKTKKYQLFNKGHIYEATDVSTAEADMENNASNFNLVSTYVFAKHLQYDSIIASKGGDNPFTNTSIKSNSANLYSYNTVGRQLYVIKQILDQNDGFKNKEEIENALKYLFLDESKFENTELYQTAADNMVNKLLKEFSTAIEKI